MFPAVVSISIPEYVPFMPIFCPVVSLIIRGFSDSDSMDIFTDDGTSPSFDSTAEPLPITAVLCAPTQNGLWQTKEAVNLYDPMSLAFLFGKTGGFGTALMERVKALFV